MADGLTALDAEWLNQQPPKLQGGLLLRAYRERAGLKQLWLAEIVKASPPNLLIWEKGNSAIPVYKVGSLAGNLELAPYEAEDFILRVNPSLSGNRNLQWLREQIEKNQWDKINFPALSPEWLAQQPDNKQVGLFLKAARQRRVLSQRQLAVLTGLTRETINHWESGTTFSANHLGAIIKQLMLSTSESEWLVNKIAPELSLRAGSEWLKEQLHADHTHALDYPALDHAWLQAQPHKKQPGLLLKAHREYQSLSQPQLAQALLVTKSAVSDWEAGEKPLPANKLGSLTNALRLSDEDAINFIILADPGLLKTRGIEWLQHKVAAKAWNHIDHPALDAEWLDKQPASLRAGLLLKAYREELDRPQSFLAAAISRDRNAIYDMENGMVAISDKRLHQIAEALDLSAEEIARLSKVAAESREARGVKNTKTDLGSTLFLSVAQQLSSTGKSSRGR